MMIAQQAAELQKSSSDVGKTPKEPEVDESSTEAPESPGVPKGGEI